MLHRENASRAALSFRPDRPGCALLPARAPVSDFGTVGDIFSAIANKDRKKPFDIRAVMRSVVDQDHPVLERWADMADADTAVVCDAHLAADTRCASSASSRGRSRVKVAAERRAGPVDVWHPVPAVFEEDRPRDQRHQRQPAPGGAGQPLGLRRFAGVAAQTSARVRRRNRPSHRQLRWSDRVQRDLALPRWCFRRLLQCAERQHGGARGRAAHSPRLSAAPPRPPWFSPARSTPAPKRIRLWES